MSSIGSLRRSLIGGFAAALAACGGGGDGGGGSGGGGGGGGGSGAAAPITFQVKSPEVDVQSGQEIAYCYFFRLPMSSELFIKQWSATFTPGVKRIVLSLTKNALAPEGTLTSAHAECSLWTTSPAQGGTLMTWAFEATKSGDQFVFPPSDGNGAPVGLRAEAGQAAMLWIHMLNESEVVLRPTVTVTGTTYPPGTRVTRADSFVTNGYPFAVLPLDEADYQDTCSTPVGARFFALSMHTNRQVRDLAISTANPAGGAPLQLFQKEFAQGEDKLVPGVKRFDAPSFITFTNDQMTYACGYYNPGNRKILPGDSVTDDEVCMAVTHYFPATEPLGCFGDFPLP